MQYNKNKFTEAITPLNEEAPVISINKEQTFDYFFRKYYIALCFFAQSIIHNEEEAKDIVQDCFIKLWNSDLEEKKDTVKSFLYTMVRNSCITYIRRKTVLSKGIVYLQNNADNFEYFDELAFAEMVRLVLKHIEALPAKTGIIIKKYYLQGKRHKKIAVELSSTENAIQIQKNRAIKLLRKKLLLFSK